jgi:hypothetical protein
MYFHAAADFPTKETFTNAVRAGNYATWPGLTTTLISKHFPDSDETQKSKGAHERTKEGSEINESQASS